MKFGSWGGDFLQRNKNQIVISFLTDSNGYENILKQYFQSTYSIINKDIADMQGFRKLSIHILLSERIQKSSPDQNQTNLIQEKEVTYSKWWGNAKNYSVK